MSPSTWSVWRVLGIWLAWFLLLAGAAVGSLAFVIWRQRQRGTFLVGGDFAVAVTGVDVLRGALVLLAPPLVITLLWLWRRLGSR